MTANNDTVTTRDDSVINASIMAVKDNNSHHRSKWTPNHTQYLFL